MIRANQAEVKWDPDKRHWVVRVRVGEEVIRRSCKGAGPEIDTEALRTLAIESARDDGYELSPESVVIDR